MRKDLPILVAFLNRLAHDEGFHPAFEWERWYDVKRDHLLNYEVLYTTVSQNLNPIFHPNLSIGSTYK